MRPVAPVAFGRERVRDPWLPWGPILLAVIGVLLAFRVPLASGFERIHLDEGDVRHLNYVLEHAWLWASGNPAHDRFWSPPVFYPQQNTEALGENLLGLLPFYAPFRLAGVSAEAAFQLVLISSLLASFAAAYALFRRGFRVGAVGAAAGAYLFAFGAPRIQRLQHAHLLFHAFTALAVLALIEAFRESEAGRPRRASAWAGAFIGSCVAQVYSGMYLGWFLAFGLGLALVAGLSLRADARSVLRLARNTWPTLLAGSVLASLALLPLAVPYSKAAAELGPRSFDSVIPFLPPVKAWLNPGPTSVLYGSWLGQWDVFSRLPFSWEKQFFPGFATLAAIGWGTARLHTSQPFRICLVSAALLVLLATSWPGGHTLWQPVFETLPGASSVRAVGRLILILLVPAGAALAATVDALSRWSRAAAVGLLLVVGAEQLQSLPSFETGPVRARVDAVAAAIPPGCAAFYYSPVLSGKPFWVTQLDAMWASVATGVPTVNGYSSSHPRVWEPLMAHELSFRDEPRVRSSLTVWLASKGLPPESVCWVQLPGKATSPGDQRK
jgi:hypothetical protein